MSEPPFRRDPSPRLCSQAQALIDVGRSAEAVPLLQRAIGADPQSLRARCLIALALLKLRQLPPGLRAAEDAIGLDPTSEWAHRLRSILLREMGKNRAALAAAHEAARLAPELPFTLANLVHAQLANRRRKEARATAERLVALAPAQAGSHEALGDVVLRDRRWREAAAHYRTALELNPQSGHAMNNLGVALQRLGKQREAIEQFHNAARRDPKAETPRKNLYQAVGAYGGVPFLVIWLAIRFFAEAGRRFAEFKNPAAICAVGLLCVLIVLVVWYWNRRRLAGLHPTVVTFHREERRRAWARWARRGPAWAALILGTLVTGQWAILWAQLGWESAGLRGAGLAIYLATAAGTVAAWTGLAWRRWKARPLHRTRR
jgi:tetratricopeptide (TPR) repeat protein